MIEKLLKAGADANAAATEGETALMTAARTGNVEAAKVLLDHGATRGRARESGTANRADVGRRGEASRDGAGVDRARSRRKRPRRSQEMGTADHFRAARKMAPAGGPDARCCSPPAKAAWSAPRFWWTRMRDINVVDPDGISATRAGDHQRPLRRRGFPDRKGREPQSGG